MTVSYDLSTDRFDGGYDPQHGRLLSLCVRVTDRCNLSCSYCLAADYAGGASIAALSCALRDYQPLRVVLSGGEPFLLSNRLADFLAAAAEGGASRIISTNGTLPLPDWLTPESVDWVDVSLPASNQRHYQAVRGADEFDNVLQNLRLLAQRGIRTRVSCMLPREFQVDLREFKSILDAAGVTNVRFGWELDRSTSQPLTGDHDEASSALRAALREWGPEYVTYPPPDESLHQVYLRGYVVLEGDDCYYSGYRSADNRLRSAYSLLPLDERMQDALTANQRLFTTPVSL